MARTGSALLALLVAAPAFAADLEFYMTADRNKVGTEDTLRLEIVVGNAPEGALVQFPAPSDFEVLSRGESTQMSYSLGSGGQGVIKQVRKYTLIMRANRAGTLTIPPASLQAGSRTYKTDPVTVEVTKGRSAPDPRTAPRRPPPPNPFGLPPGFLPDEPDDDGEPLGNVDIPRSDSDLFIRTQLDRNEVYVGEQVTLSIFIYSRLDLSSVDAITLPKLDGFWSVDTEQRSQLTASQKVINGVPYREFLVRRRALFPMKPGETTIEPVEADITTGFMFAGHRVHRKSNILNLKAKALPAGGTGGNVGQWRLTTELSQSEVTLGDPVQVKVILEGTGNLQSVQLPALTAPAGVKVFDPQTTDKPAVTRGAVGGARTLEYVLVPQQTGEFELPALTLPFFDPQEKRWSEAHTDALHLKVKPAANGQTALGPSGPATGAADGPKNQLVAGGLKSLRHSARFERPTRALWQNTWFTPVALAPLGLTVLGFAFTWLRRAAGGERPEAQKKRLAKAARRRLAEAEKLLAKGSTTQFYEEVARALTAFIDARLGSKVSGLTRAELDAALAQHGVVEAERQRVAQVLDTCDTGRYAPGMGEASARRKAIEDAAAAMEAWS